MKQKLYQIKLLLFVMAFLCLSPGLFSIKASAAGTDRTIYCIESTENSITIDFSAAAENVLREKKKEWPQCYMEKFQVTCYIPGTPNVIVAGPGVNGPTLSGSARQHTFTGLEPDTQYCVSVAYYINNKPGSQLRNSSTFSSHEFCTAKTQPLKVLGTSGTTATIDYRDYIKNIKTELDAKSVWPDLYLGYADQSIGKEAALKKAKEMAGRKQIEIDDTQGNYMLRGLTPGHTYSIVIYASYSTSLSSYGDYRLRYYQATDVTTDSENDADLFAEDKSFVPMDSNTRDEVIYGKTLQYAGTSNSTFMFSSTSTDDSITIDWSKQRSETKEIIPAKDMTNIEVSCVESENYNPDADKRQYGRYPNLGPNVRNAVKKVEASPIKVKNGESGYTFEGLKKDTCYTIVVKCGTKDTDKTVDTVYGYDETIFTGTERSMKSIRNSIERTASKPYMFDVDLKRNGLAVNLDWTSALNQFISQPTFKDCTPDVSTTTGGISGNSKYSIGYAELPDTDDESAIRDSYKAAEKMAYNYRELESITVSDNYTRYRVYGLDPDKKYVFAIYFRPTLYYYGASVYNTGSQYFYADERGVNYYKNRDLNANKTDDSPKPTPQDQEQNKPIENPKEETKPEEKTDPKEDEKTQEETQPKTDVNPEETPKSETAETTENAPIEVKSSDNKAADEPVNGKKADKAWIYQDIKKISAGKKKAQKVILNVENSKGKITVKNVSKKKLLKGAKIKIKGRKVIIKLKKNAPKGTYKFKVTVGAKGKIKKTTTTVKVVVK